jgi:hypothetical protein
MKTANSFKLTSAIEDKAVLKDAFKEAVSRTIIAETIKAF